MIHMNCITLDTFNRAQSLICNILHEHLHINNSIRYPFRVVDFRFHLISSAPDSKVHGANMRPIWVLSASGEPHVGAMNLAIRGNKTCKIGWPFNANLNPEKLEQILCRFHNINRIQVIIFKLITFCAVVISHSVLFGCTLHISISFRQI